MEIVAEQQRMKWKLYGSKSELQEKKKQGRRERSGETETWQPTKEEKRNGYHKTERQKGHGQRQ